MRLLVARIMAATVLAVGMAGTAAVSIPATAKAPTGLVMVKTQRMSGPSLTTTQYGWYYKGSRLSLSCYVRGQSVYGYFGGPDNIWYKVSDGKYVADIDLETGSNYPIAPACAGSGNISAPFRAGQTWYVCQGYNGSISHSGQPALDMTVNAAGVGTTGCTGDVNASANQPVYAPASGTLYRVSDSVGAVCINLTSGHSILLAHLLNRRANGAVSTGTQIGIVAPAGQVGNGGYAHVHLQAHSGTGCGSSPKVPFDAAHGLRFVGGPDMTYSGATNQWRGTALRR